MMTKKELPAPGVRPLNDAILVLPIEPAEMSAGGIIRVNTAKESGTHEGTVIAVGPGRILQNGDRVRAEVERGQRVMYLGQRGVEVNLDGVKYVMIPEAEILGVFADGIKTR